jgi:hypothetical protein
MAITEKQFEQGLDVNKNKIIDFLESNPDKAYPYQELAENTDLPQSGISTLYFKMMLSDLARVGLIEKKIIKIQNYYRAVRKIEAASE